MTVGAGDEAISKLTFQLPTLSTSNLMPGLVAPLGDTKNSPFTPRFDTPVAVLIANWAWVLT